MIDDHCHPFSLEGGPLDLASLTLDVEDAAGAEDRDRIRPTSLFQELLATRLAGRLGCRVEEITDARAEAASDWQGYVSGLFSDAGLSGLVMDPAYPPATAEQVARYGELSGCSIHLLKRIDPAVDSAVLQGMSAKEIVSLVEDEMSAAAGAGCVGFKTILAYRTGLDVAVDVSLDDAQRSLDESEGLPVRRRGKACRDLVLKHALGVAAELGLPFQFHTGFGETDIRLRESNPLLLEELLRTPQGGAVRLVLIHGAFPYHEEVGFLANRPNVHVDISLFNIFAPLRVGERILRVLDLAPAGKVLFGTDGFNEPELFWFAAVVLRDAWAAARADLRDAGARRTWIDEMERMMFETNARELYGI